MKLQLPAIAAALVCCLSCVEVDSKMGGNLIPVDQTYTVHPTETAIPQGMISMQFADSLSGFNQSRITIGAIRDNEYGLTGRACALTLIPPFDTMDFGNKSALIFKGMHFGSALDTISVSAFGQEHIIQNVEVFALTQPLDPGKDSDVNNCGDNIKVDFSKRINKGNPVINGTDSLTFDFTDEFARKYLDIELSDLKNYKQFTKKYPGIYIRTDNPMGLGGRINMFEVQLGWDQNYGYILGDYAEFKFKGDYDNDGRAETDTSFFFAFGLTKFVDIDSLLNKGARGNYPQYVMNITTQQTRQKAGPARDKVLIEGGGGLKPVISAVGLKHLAEKLISEKGGDPRTAVINKASIILPFEFPQDYREMFKFPQVLSPTCRIRGDSTVVYSGLTDASSKDENQGEINRSLLCYQPDITYHIQELLKINETPVPGETDTQKTKRKMLLGGEFDIWLLNMAYEIETTSNSSSSEMSEYYQYLAYQSYYNNMYGGYGGYGGYGYGGYGGYGYGGDYYSNYYNYMMMAQYANSSSTSTSYTTKLDTDRFYCSALNGPDFSDSTKVPTFKLTFSLANE